MVRTKHRIGRYRVIAPIGAGGFSTVYRAIDEETDLEVAIKVLAENHSMVPDTRRRFVDEFNLRSTVSSPFIAKMYEVGVVEETGQPYMVLELASRGDLRRRVEEVRRSHQVLNRADLMMLARHLTEALTALHDADIVHRDVSPGNILIRSHPSSGARQGSLERGNVSLLEPGERFLLADLGHAKDLIRSSGFTAGGGTQGFAAPEQRDDITVVDHRADIFSATAIIEWAAHDGIHADALEPFCDIGLAEDPDDRFPSMAAWYDGISAALGQDRDAPGRIRRLGRNRRNGRSVDETNGAGSVEVDSGPSPAVRPPGPGVVESDQGTEWTESKGRRWPRHLVIAGVCLAAMAIPIVVASIIIGGRSSETDPATLGGVDGDATASITAGGQDPDTTATTATTGPLVVQPDELPGDRAYISLGAPVDLATIDDDLIIDGVAHQVVPAGEVQMTVQHQTTGGFWTPNGWSDVGDPFPVELRDPVPDEPTSRRFHLEIPADDLQPGDYVVKVWPPRVRGDEEPTDPAEIESRTVTVE